ncbi:hypothetical protein EYR40_008610 [Pleurotus pulmonarius]|nr:hypothetical protein EYR36_009429 [Pleurotus pulmonarius]KAF4593816.1 hypothetical protein EYR40_008610 [Pleurotus pulmonarius]
MALQEVLSTLVSSTESMPNATFKNSEGPAPRPHHEGSQSDLKSLLLTLLSFSALQDWIKLIIIGGFFEAARRVAMSLYSQLLNTFFITVSFEEDDPSYDWMMVWLSKQKTWNKARQYQVSTKSFGLDNLAIAIPGDDDEHTGNSSRKLAYLPSTSSSYSLWYKRHWITVSRQRTVGSFTESLVLSIFARSHTVLNEILRDAKQQYTSSQEHKISIYICDKSNSWRLAATRPKRPLHSIVLEPGVKELLVDDARDFLDNKSWYVDRGIPFRRGYLLYGAPGSGKTSTIHSIAGELGLDVYIISLSRAGLDDSSLSELVSDLPERCIALMEDIDAAFHHGINREAKTNVGDTNRRDFSSSRLSLSGLLNALDGVGAQEGRILYATTNKYLNLDPALCRPGRMDIHVEFRLASKFQTYELFRRFYLPSGAAEDIDVNDEDEDEDEKGSDGEGSDSGYGESLDGDANDSEMSLLMSSSDRPTSPFAQGRPPVTGNAHCQRPPKLSRRRLAKLAQSFADAVPEREFSMAALQGYLMGYKIRPFEAVRDILGWLEAEKEKQKLHQRGAAPKSLAQLAPVALDTKSETHQLPTPLTPTSPIRRDHCIDG